MAPTHTKFDVAKLAYADTAKISKPHNRKSIAVTYDGSWNVGFQLGATRTPLRCPFGIDSYENKQGAVEKSIKLELTDETRAFVKGVEGATIDAAVANSAEWFGKAYPKEQLEENFNSCIKGQDGGRPDCIKLKVKESGAGKTDVVRVVWKGEKVTAPVAATLEDVTGKSMVVPVVRIQGGVYFMGNGGKTFGTSMVADGLLIVEGAPGGATTAAGMSVTYDLGDVETVEAKEGDAEDDK
jgi:hypothetical protein